MPPVSGDDTGHGARPPRQPALLSPTSTTPFAAAAGAGGGCRACPTPSMAPATCWPSSAASPASTSSAPTRRGRTRWGQVRRRSLPAPGVRACSPFCGGPPPAPSFRPPAQHGYGSSSAAEPARPNAACVLPTHLLPPHLPCLPTAHAVGRVFTSGEPEMSHNVQRYDRAVYLRVGGGVGWGGVVGGGVSE